MEKQEARTAPEFPAPSPRRVNPFATLGWRILAWIALVAFVPLVIMAVQGYHCAREAIAESQQMHLRSVVESRKARLEGRLAQIRADLEVLAMTPCLRGDCGGALAEKGARSLSKDSCGLLEEVRRSNPSYETIETYDPAWQRFAAGKDEARPVQERPGSEFESALEKANDFVIMPRRNATTSGLTLLAGHPIYGSDSNKVGYVVARVNVTAAFDVILRDRSGLGEKGAVYLLSADGRPLYSEQPARTRPARGTGFPDALREKAGENVLEYEDPRGAMVLGASARLAPLDWVVVAELDRGEAFAWLGMLRERALVTGGVTLLFVLLIAVQGARRLSQPLKELAAVARNIAAGRHGARVGPLAGAEAQDVAEAFNRMLDELAASQRRLTHAASLAAVGELSSSIVHEMRNPLSSVKINLQALRKKVEGDPAYAELGGIALEQLGRVEKMLSDLLGYGKPLQLNLSETTIAEVVKDVLEVVRKEAQDKAVALELDNQLGERPITVDREQLARALTNLVANAIQAVGQGGTVGIAARPEDGRARFAIAVSDNGPGIPDARKDDLFKPFFTTRKGGTGLGLANVKKIVEYHGGTYRAENRSEGGAVFTLVLPAGGSRA